MNQDLNDVKIPKGASYKDQEILKVLNVVVSEVASESGYVVLLGNGDKEFISSAKFAKLSEPSEEEGDEE
jgi:hypothetical protein